jgi:8-oxoguanine deaminase
MMSGSTLLLKDISVLATLNDELGDIKNATIYIESGVIQWVGAACDLPPLYANADVVLSLTGRVVIPGRVSRPFDELHRVKSSFH